MRSVRRFIVSLTALAMLAPLGAQAAPPEWAHLGEDPAGDSIPTLDLTYLDVVKRGNALEIRFGMNELLPVIGSVPPELPGIEWVFESNGTVYVAEAVPGSPPTFYLFEYDGKTFEQSSVTPSGEFLWDQGYIHMTIPLKAIGAKKGTVLSGSDALGGTDVDAHIHMPAGGTQYPDQMQTTKSYTIP
jgi:hypothetical protein